MPTGIYKRKPFTRKHLENMRKAKNSGRFKNGHSQLNTGRTYFKKGHIKTKEWIEIMSEKMRGNTYTKGMEFSERKSPPPFTEEHKRKIREYQINNPNKKFKDTSIELKVEKELQQRGIDYKKQIPLCDTAIVDFYLPSSKVVIQCDGDYWHNKVGRKEIDKRQDEILLLNGFNVYRFWGSEINESVENCIDRIL